MTPEEMVAYSRVAPGGKPVDSDEEDGASWTRSAGAEASAGHKRTIAALQRGEPSVEPGVEPGVIAMAIYAKNCSLPTLGVEPSDPGGDRSVVWLQTHHLAVNINLQKSVWRLFLLEHGDPTFCAKEIFAGLGLLRPGVSPMLLASAPICVHREALARNAKAGIPGDEIDLMLSDGSQQKRGHAMSASVIRGLNEVVTLKPVGHHGYVVITFLQIFTHEATFQADEAWLLDKYPHLAPLLHKPAAIVMANNEKALTKSLLLASVEDMSPGSKEAIFQKGRSLLLQKAKHLINAEKQAVDGSRLLFYPNHRSGLPIVNFQQLATMRWAPDVFKEESVFNAGESGHQGSESVSRPPATLQGVKAAKNAAPIKAIYSLAAGALSSDSKMAAHPAHPAAALAASSPTVTSSCSKSSSGTKTTQPASSKAKQSHSSLKPKQGPSSVSNPKIAAKQEHFDTASALDRLDSTSVVESLHEALGLGSPTFDSLDIASTLDRIDGHASRTCAKSGADAAFKYIKGRTSVLANGAWKNYLDRMETKAHQAATLDELRNVERDAKSYYEDLVSAMNVLYAMAQKYSPPYTPHSKQGLTLEAKYQDVLRAVAKGKATFQESANERKRSRGGTPPVHPLSLMPPPQQPSLPSEIVDVLKQMGQTISEAKKARPEAQEADAARVRDLEKELEIVKAAQAAEEKHGSKMAVQESLFQAESSTSCPSVQGPLHCVLDHL